MLHRCLDQRPGCVEARMLLMENVMAQGRLVYWRQMPSPETSDLCKQVHAPAPQCCTARRRANMLQSAHPEGCAGHTNQ